MKRIMAVGFAIFSSHCMYAQSNIGIGTNTPNASAILDVNSTNKGLLIPRMTTAQRNDIVSPANGLLVFDTNKNEFWYYKSNTWTALTSQGFSLPYIGNTASSSNAFLINNDGVGTAIKGTNTALYGIGVYGLSTADYSYGVYAGSKMKNATALTAYADSGTAVNAVTLSDNNTSTTLRVVNQGLGPAGYIATINPNSTTHTLQISNMGKGSALTLSQSSAATSHGILMYNNGLGNGIYIAQSNVSNTARAIWINQEGNGHGVYVNSAGHGVWSTSNSSSHVAVTAENSTYGEAIKARSKSASSNGTIVAQNDSSGYAVKGYSTKNGTGIYGHAGFNNAPSIAGLFENSYTGNTQPVLVARSNGTGTVLNVITSNTATTTNLAVFTKRSANVARIDSDGKAFFNGGTQNSGADIAEMFDVDGEKQTYEPGDVLVISPTKDRTVEKSSEAYSSFVVGVYATKPGVILTEHDLDADLSDQVPMGVVGVIPTKVCTEGGIIKRGDLLVTSSIKGVAMKADKAKVEIGQVIGKALENFDANGVGKIKVLVNVK
jgi:hypothetical protein